MGLLLRDRWRPELWATVAAFVLFAGVAAADNTPPQLVNFNLTPLTVDTSAGPATLNVSISAQDTTNGFGVNAAGNGSLSFSLQSGNTIFSRQGLPMTGGTITNPIFQFAFTLPQFSPPGMYAISITLVDNASNMATFTAASLQALGFPSTLTVTDSAFGSVALSPSVANVPAAGGSGSVTVTASNSGFAWSATSNATWLTITSAASGMGSGMLTYQAAMNNLTSQRTGIITVSGQTVTVIQAAASSALNTTAGSLVFTYQIGGAAPAPQTITAFSSGAPLNFTATASSVGNWLFVSPSSGVTSTVLSIFVNPIGLAAGTYTGSVTVAASASSNGSQTEAVTLVVSGGPAITVTPSSLSFVYQLGSSQTPIRLLSVSAGTATSFTASASSAGAWLAVNPASSTTPSTLTVSISPAGLATGAYSGSVSVSTATGSQNIPVTLIVSPALTVSPTSLTFSYTLGGAVPPPQTLLLSGDAGLGFSTTASSVGDWLAVGAADPQGGVSVSVSPINAAKLAAGVYTGAITVTAIGGALQNVPVTLVVTAAANFSVSPSTLVFNAQLGTAKQTQFLTVTATDPSATFTASARGLSGLSVDTTGTFTPRQQVGVSMDSSSLQPGTYVGNILISGLNSSQVVPVTVFVDAAVVTTAPSSLTFTYQSGGSIPASQVVSVNSNGTGVGFSAAASSAGSWLSVSPATGVTPGALTVSVAPLGLALGTYNGSITVSEPSLGGRTQTVPVSLTVIATGQVTVSPTSLTINYQVGDPNPSLPSITLSGVALAFTALASSTGNWLAVSPTSGTTPATLNAQVSPAGLAPGTYTGLVQITPAGQAMQTVTITLNVHAPQNLTLSPTSLSFSYQIGGTTPAPQIITVGCANSALSFRPTASSAGNWLSTSVPNVQGNNQIIVSVNPAGLASGSYSGTVTIFGVGACNTTQTVPVTLAVSGGAGQLVTSNASSLAFAYQIGGAVPAAQTVPISCNGAVETFIVSNIGSWLRTSPASALTPATLTVSVDPTGLAAGSYTGSATITFYGACTGNQTVSVSLVVTASQPLTVSTLTFSAAALSFTATAGGAAPAMQAVSLTCSSGAPPFQVTATSNGGWLSASPLMGNTTSTVTVSVNPAGLAAGSYAGSISATATGCGATPALPVSLTVNPAPAGPAVTPGVTITPASLAFSYQTGGANPADQTLLLTGGAGQSFTATASGGGWISVNPGAGVAPGSVIVSVNPAGLTAGTYSGAVLITTSTGTAGATQNIVVTLTVTGAVTAPITIAAPTITSLVSGASFLPSPLAPGEIISLFGRGLGPPDSVPMRLTPGGLVDNSLAGTRVIIDGTPAPVLYTQAGLVNAIVPFSVAGKSTVQVQIEYQGVRSAPVSFVVAAAAPAIFTIDGSGRGQGAVLDQDTSVNSDLNPGDRGSVMVLYASGAGQMVPPSDDGAITGTVLAKPVAPVSVLVDGQDTEILYAGAAPGLVAGVLQVNFRVPPQVRTGSAIGILLKVGRFTSQPGVTVAIR